MPADVQAKLLAAAMGSSPPPYVLSDFPRMAQHVPLLESTAGRVACALHVREAGEADDRMTLSLLKPLREDERVHDVVAGDGAVDAAIAVLRAAGVLEGELPPAEEQEAQCEEDAQGSEEGG